MGVRSGEHVHYTVEIWRCCCLLCTVHCAHHVFEVLVYHHYLYLSGHVCTTCTCMCTPPGVSYVIRQTTIYHSHHGVVNTCTYILHDNNNKEWQRNYCIFFLLVYNYSGRSNGLLDLTFLTHSHSHRIRHLSDDQLFPPSFTCAGLGTTDDVHHHHPPSERPQPHCRFTSFLFTRSCTPMGQFHRAFHQC